MTRCQADGMTSTGVDYGLCGLTREEHEGTCPVCGGSGEYEGDDGPRGCMPCLTGLGPHGHAFTAGREGAQTLTEISARHAGGMGPLSLDELFPVVGTVEDGAHA